jgi:hypothetical protein
MQSYALVLFPQYIPLLFLHFRSYLLMKVNICARTHNKIGPHHHTLQAEDAAYWGETEKSSEADITFYKIGGSNLSQGTQNRAKV